MSAESRLPLEDEVLTLRQENLHLKSQVSLLSQLTHRVASSLDLRLVLQQVVDAACELTGARYGALALFDAAGEFERLFTCGLSNEQREFLGELPHGRGVLGVLHQMDRPLRLSDLTTHVRHAGFPAEHPSMTTFLGTNIRAEGVVQGSIY